jgi:hypothetical protein
MPQNVRFELELEGCSIDLVPESEDRRRDLAVLHVKDTDRPKVRPGMVLPLTDRQVESGLAFHATGFPDRTEGADRTWSGEITNPSTGNERVELYVKQGTRDTWEGMSGAAVIIDDAVAGVVIDQSGYPDSTGFAAPSAALKNIVPELRGIAHRREYCRWFRNEFQSPGWCGAYEPRMTVDALVIETADSLSERILADRNDSRVWLIVGDDAEGRDSLIRKVADAFVQHASTDIEGCFDLAVWYSQPDYRANPLDPLRFSREKLEHGNAIRPEDAEPILADLTDAIQTGRALLVADVVDADEIARLRQAAGKCRLLAGVSPSVADKIPDARNCRIMVLSEKDRRQLASYWISDSRKSADGSMPCPSFFPSHRDRSTSPSGAGPSRSSKNSWKASRSKKAGHQDGPTV